MAASRRHRTARRLAERRLQERLSFHRGLVAFGLMLLAAAAVAVPAIVRTTGDEPQPIAQVPPDEPERGLVYGGLVPAKRGTPCVGGYEVGDADTCAHGPDPVPPGLDVKRPVAPITPAQPAQPLPARDTRPAPSEATVTGDLGALVAADAATDTPALVPDAAPAAFTMGPGGVACDGDGQSGRRVQVIYAYETGSANRYAEFLPSFRTLAAGVETIYSASAAETGGTRHVRFVTTPDCVVDVAEVQLPANGLDTFNNTVTALRALGFNQTDRKYMIFADATVYCGIGTFAGDDRAGSVNRSNGGPSYGRSDSGCWSAAVAAHELGHNLGAVNDSAPNSSLEGHCLDERDVMCYRDSSGRDTRVVCSDRIGEQRMDCGHDDYFHTNPSAGSYLATHWNVADNQFLIAGDGGGGGPTPTPTPTPTRPTPTRPTPTRPPPTSPTSRPPTTPTRSPTPTVNPTPTPTGTATPTPTPTPTVSPTPTLRVSSVAMTSARLTWTPGPAGTRYAIRLNGRTLGEVEVTSVRVIGLRPGREQRAQIFTVTAGGLVPYTAPVTFRTLPFIPPKPGPWLTLTNSLTGGAADVFGARAADGTPVVLNRRHDGTNQRWRLREAGGGTFLVQSAATGKCLAVGGAVRAGATLVQRTCSAASAAQAWRLVTTGYGFSLAPTGVDLVVGVSGSTYYGRRPLVLQTPNQRRYQSWTAVT